VAALLLIEVFEGCDASNHLSRQCKVHALVRGPET
jgi:hypothetical protein